MRRNGKSSYEKKPLWRKVNTRTHNVRHRPYDVKYERGKKEDDLAKSKMKSGKKCHGIDLTALYGFLRKNVGKNWDAVKSEALSRLPPEDPRNPYFESVVILFEDYELYTEEEKKYCVFRIGESSYCSTMYVDEDGLLQIVSPNFTAMDLTPSCPCCTHTLNGKEVPRHLYPKY